MNKHTVKRPAKHGTFYKVFMHFDHVTMQANHVTCFVSQFMQDAQEVMDMLVKVQNDQGEMEPDDPQVRK